MRSHILLDFGGEKSLVKRDLKWREMLFNNRFASEVCPSLFQEVMQTDIERMTQMDKQRN